jgi:hypothetical protein
MPAAVTSVLANTPEPLGLRLGGVRDGGPDGGGTGSSASRSIVTPGQYRPASYVGTRSSLLEDTVAGPPMAESPNQ